MQQYPTGYIYRISVGGKLKNIKRQENVIIADLGYLLCLFFQVKQQSFLVFIK